MSNFILVEKLTSSFNFLQGTVNELEVTQSEENGTMLKRTSNANYTQGYKTIPKAMAIGDRFEVITKKIGSGSAFYYPLLADASQEINNDNGLGFGFNGNDLSTVNNGAGVATIRSDIAFDIWYRLAWERTAADTIKLFFNDAEVGSFSGLTIGLKRLFIPANFYDQATVCYKFLGISL